MKFTVGMKQNKDILHVNFRRAVFLTFLTKAKNASYSYVGTYRELHKHSLRLKFEENSHNLFEDSGFC